MSEPSDHKQPSTTTHGHQPDDGDATPSYAQATSAAASDYADKELADEELAETDQTVISSQLPIETKHSLDSLRPRELGHLLEGRRLDHFQLEEFIGGGGMGAVFRAHDTVLGRTVAVKVLAASAAGSEENRLRFHNEAQSAARLDHPNIAQVHYVGEDQGFNYIVFEYVEGINLRDRVARFGPLPLADALRFTLQIAEALAHAWQRDIVHRDIKPSNVLATPEGQVKLVDMGLARLRDVTTQTEDLTASGMTLGTFDYISPEQARDPRHADSRSDIYSLGCTLYYMLCGRPPFQGGTAVQKLLMHQTDEPPSPREFRPGLPLGVEQLLGRMLAKSPDARFQNPAELIAAMATLADQLGIAVQPTTTVQLTVAEHESSWLTGSIPWLVPAALLLGIVFIIDYVDRSASGEWTPPDWASGSALSLRSDVANGAPRGAERRASEPTIAEGSPNGLRLPDGGEGSVNGELSGQGQGALDTPAASSSDERSASGEPLPPTGMPVLARLMTAWQRAAESFNWDPFSLFGSASDGAPPHVPSDSLQATPEFVVRNVYSRKTYDALVEAWDEAEDEDVLEIGSEGLNSLARMELPLSVVRKHITIRGRRGVWPVLRVTTNIGAGPRRHVFAVEEGSLTLENLELELAPEFAGSQGTLGWGMIELRAGATVEMVGCRVTIRSRPNGGTEMRDRDDVFVVQGESSTFPDGAPPPNPVEIDLKGVTIRGGDNLVTVEGDAHIDLNIDNGLFLLHGYLYDAKQREMNSQGASKIRLNHVTADLGEGAFRIREVGMNAWLQADVRNSVLLGRNGKALVEHDTLSGTLNIPLVWQADGNVYGGWSWIFRQSASSDANRFNFVDWQAYWANRQPDTDRNSRLYDSPLWAEPLSEIPMFEREPYDYVLSDLEQYAAPGADGNNGPPGIDAERLTVGQHE